MLSYSSCLSLWPCLTACQILVPQPGPAPRAVEAQSCNHWTTRDISLFVFLSLTYFTKQSTLQVHSSCCKWWNFILFYDWLVFWFVYVFMYITSFSIHLLTVVCLFECNHSSGTDMVSPCGLSYFLASPYITWYLSYPARDRTPASCIGSMES